MLPGRQARVRSQIWQRVTGRWVTVTGKRRERDVLITSHGASPAGVTLPSACSNARFAALAELHAERRRCIKIRPRRGLRGLDRDCQPCEELLITARRAVVPARPTAARGVWRSRADEEFGGPSGHPETPRVERTRTPWDKLEPGRGVFGSRQTRSFWASTCGVRIRDFWATLPISEWRGSPKSGAGPRIVLASFCSAQVGLL
jgi:hypothetical protein